MASAASADLRPPPPPYITAIATQEGSRELPPGSITWGHDALVKITEVPPNTTAYKVTYTAIPHGAKTDLPALEAISRTAKPFLTRFFPLAGIHTPYSHSFDVGSALQRYDAEGRFRLPHEVVMVEQTYVTSKSGRPSIPNRSLLLLTALKPRRKGPTGPLTHMHFHVCPESMKAKKELSLRSASIMNSTAPYQDIPFRITVEERLSSKKKVQIDVKGDGDQKSLIVPLSESGTLDDCIKTAAKILHFTFTVLETDWKPYERKVDLYSLPPNYTPTFTVKRERDGTSMKIKYKEVAPPSAGKASSPPRESKKEKKDSASGKE